jgi:hypothetical protein
MRGISRSGFFKNHGLEKSKGAPTSTLPPGVDATFIPVISGVNVLLYNPKNIPYGSVTPAPILSPSLRSNLKAIAQNSIKKPSAMVVFTAHHAPNTELFVSVVYSSYNDFPSSDIKEKNLIIRSNSAVTFSLNDLLPGTTYYVKTQARSLATGISSVWTPSYPIIINTPSAPINGVFGGVYYINGHATSLSLNGTGEWEGVYYINGQATPLVELDGFGWSGVYNGLQYYGGNVADGYINTKWWYNGVESIELFYNGGNGVLNGLLFQSFSPVTGFYSGNWYTQGNIKPGLNSQGNGIINDIVHVAGVPYTGTQNGTYYINGEPTALGPGGTGTWNGQFYSAGVYVGTVGNPYDAGQTSSQGSRFSSGVTYG